MGNDESLELIRQARLRRREKKVKPVSTTKPKTSAKKPLFDMASLSEEDKRELLALLEDE